MRTTLTVVLLLVLFPYGITFGQQKNLSRYGVEVLDDLRDYTLTFDRDSAKRLLPLSTIPGIRLDLRYATKMNFMGRRMYPASTRQTYLRLPAALALGRLTRELAGRGLGLLVWDAYRPYGVTVAFWELVKDERYVAHPGKGSNHNRGLAVDCTLYELSSGQPLDMGTGFDNFTDTAHHTFTALPDSVIARRRLLRETMERHGFKAFDTEWWHYAWSDNKTYEVLDLPFRKLDRLR